jgi:hypothetical protein
MHALLTRLPEPPPVRSSAPGEWRVAARLLAGAALFGAIIGSIGCSSSNNPTAPRGSAVVTIRVVGEQYRLLLTTQAQIEAARAAQGGGANRIPNGRLVSGAQVNAGYSWHVEDVEFAFATIEVCDGLPSHVEREGVAFGTGRYCPWAAEIVRIEMTP